MLNQPPVNSIVSITTEHQSNLLGQTFDYAFYDEVKVCPSQKHDRPNTFRVTAADSMHIHERVINLSNVRILIVDGQQYIDDGTSNDEPIEVKVQGSKGQQYTVTVVGDVATKCTCKGYQFRNTCRHLAEALTCVDLSMELR